MTVKRKWYKGKRLIYSGKRKVLCAECPCGCRYTYYVDHSLATSGDGLTWETAFNTINRVFALAYIKDYRDAGCTIYVKIRGAVNYRIDGQYLAYSMENYVYLQPEDDDHRVTYNFFSSSEDSLYLVMREFYTVYVVFEKWDFNLKQKAFQQNKHVKFIDCNFTRTSGDNVYNITINDCDYIYFSRCNFNIDIANPYTYATILNSCEYVQMYSCSFEFTISGETSYSTIYMYPLWSCRYSMFEQINASLNVSNPNITNLLSGFESCCRDSFFNTCTSARNFSSVIANIFYCRFSVVTCASDWPGGNTFYLCAQDCYKTGSLSLSCDTDCHELS